MNSPSNASRALSYLLDSMSPCAFVTRLQTALDPAMGHTPDEIALFLEGLKGVGFEKAVGRAEAMVGQDQTEMEKQHEDGRSVMLVSQSTQTSPPEVGASEPNIANPPCLRCGFKLRAIGEYGDNASSPNPLWLTIRAPMSTENLTANPTLSDPMTLSEFGPPPFTPVKSSTLPSPPSDTVHSPASPMSLSSNSNPTPSTPPTNLPSTPFYTPLSSPAEPGSPPLYGNETPSPSPSKPTSDHALTPSPTSLECAVGNSTSDLTSILSDASVTTTSRDTSPLDSAEGVPSTSELSPESSRSQTSALATETARNVSPHEKTALSSAKQTANDPPPTRDAPCLGAGAEEIESPRIVLGLQGTPKSPVTVPSSDVHVPSGPPSLTDAQPHARGFLSPREPILIDGVPVNSGEETTPTSTYTHLLSLRSRGSVPWVSVCGVPITSPDVYRARNVPWPHPLG